MAAGQTRYQISIVVGVFGIFVSSRPPCPRAFDANDSSSTSLCVLTLVDFNLLVEARTATSQEFSSDHTLTMQTIWI
jgi:hypothetical protein